MPLYDSPMPLHDPPFLSLSDRLKSSLNLHTALSKPSITSLPTTPSPNITSLPNELLTQILQEVIVSECEGSPSAYYSTMHYFAHLLYTSKQFYHVGTEILYRHVAFADPHTFDKFLATIQRTGYGTLVRTMDFSGLTSVGLGRTAKMNKQIQMLTPTTIANALDLCPNLNEFLGTENIELELDAVVLNKLLRMPYLEAIDFCGATDSAFVDAMTEVVNFDNNQKHQQFPQITRLSLHACSTLPALTIQRLLELLPNLTRLDLTHTQTTADTLLAIPTSVVLTHLSLSKCVLLSSEGALDFFTSNNAARGRRLQWLNLMFDVTRPAPISQAHLHLIIKSLPAVKYLNLHGLPVDTPILSTLAPHNLQSLSVGYADLSLSSLKALLPKFSLLQYLDLTGNPHINLWTVQDTALLNCNPGVRMFEFSSDLLSKMDGICVPGFSTAKGQGRRGWLIRGAKVPCSAALSYTNHSGPSAISGPTVMPSISSPDHKRFTFSAYAKTRMQQQNDESPPSSPPLLSLSPSPSPPQQQQQLLQSMAGRSSRAHLRASAGQVFRSPSPSSRPVTVLGMDMGTQEWTHASRKVNVCFVGIGGNRTADSCKERGIYLYYGYRK